MTSTMRSTTVTWRFLNQNKRLFVRIQSYSVVHAVEADAKAVADHSGWCRASNGVGA